MSMTGYGEAHCQEGGRAVVVEVRAINSRYFKLALRLPEGYGVLESQIEPVVRKRIKRGTVQVAVRIDREPSPEDYRINDAVLSGYQRQLEKLCDSLNLSRPASLDALLSLPGVVEEAASPGAAARDEWPLIERALVEAVEHLSRMRADEGRAMAADLRTNCRAVAERLDRIADRAPLVSEAYRDRLAERLGRLLAEFDVAAEPADVVREVGVFAEKSDISEEIVRLRSHLEQFGAILDGDESAGRKLDFLTQEMFREINTIGSKANDAEIARQVVEVKAAVERLREMIQNVE